MAKRRPPSSKNVDVADLITLICGYRDERFPQERALALLTFGAWSLWPKEPDVAQRARIVGAAMLIRLTERGRIGSEEDHESLIDALFQNVLQAQSVTNALLNSPPPVFFLDKRDRNIEELQDATNIVWFFLQAPSFANRRQRASLNKAVFFIDDKCGYGSDWKRSSSFLRQNWVNYGVATPFMLSDQYYGLGAIGLAPDYDRDVLKAVRLVAEGEQLRTFFGSAKYVQRVLLERLDPESRKRVRLRLPAQLPEVPITLDPLDEQQLQKLADYKAPE